MHWKVSYSHGIYIYSYYNIFFEIPLLFFLSFFCNRFLEYDTSTKTHVSLTSHNIAPFIEFVVCPSYHTAYKKSEMSLYDIDRKQYSNGESFCPRVHGMDIPPREIFKRITYNASELLKKIVIRTLDTTEPKIIIDPSNVKNSSERVSMITKYSSTFGKCYALGISEEIIKYGIISIEIEANLDIYVYFGHPGQFMHVDTKSKVHSILSK